MDIRDVIIVGGGPAGSSCAWRLSSYGIPSLILDAQEFPRTKLCAGWITPKVMTNLEIDHASYPHGMVRLDRIVVEYFGRWKSGSWAVPTRQFSIRRYEFDSWLLRRSGAQVLKHRAREIRKENGGFVIDGLFRCRYLVGAGGTLCPVYSTFFRELNPRPQEAQVCTLEEEFELPERSEMCRLWFTENGLPGYSWCVPKGDGWVNVGIGALASRLRESGLRLKDQWSHLTRKLSDLGLVRGHEYRPGGYTYYVRSPAKVGQCGNCFITGDAAGLATSDLAEGIGPAVESGLRAAEAIAGGGSYSLDGITSHSWPGFVGEAIRSLLRAGR